MPARQLPRAAGLFALGCALALGMWVAPAHAASWTDADYWAAADRIAERVDAWWSPSRDLYNPRDLSADTMTNANMLLVHSLAALYGHQGPARADARARSIAEKLIGTPPYVDRIEPEAMNQVHAPGWLGAMSVPHSIQHLVVDAEVAEALGAAWRARDAIGLSPEVAALIAQRLRAVARGPFWRYPALRLNQINWYANVYLAAAVSNGDPGPLRRDLRAQVRRFVRGILHPAPGTAGNLGPGMRFHYVPNRSPDWALNFDSPEYANLVASFARTWGVARAAGMPDISRRDKTILRRWLARVLTGYWTHSGYLNWDTGFGFRRLHQAKKLPLAQQGLLAIAAGGDLSPGRRYAAWAKEILDRGIALYLRWMPPGAGLPPALLFDLSARPQPPAHAILAAARVAANAARAVDLGLGHRRAQEPPPFYAFDPDVGRLAVSTPRYSTAIVPVNQHAFPYGGIDIARLFDARQEVAGNIGGVPPATFGMVVRDARGHAMLETQRGRRALTGRAPLRLVRAPSGVGASPRSAPTRPFLGSFRTLVATGVATRGSLSARSTWTFRRSSLDGAWTFHAARAARRTIEVTFPSWGGSAAQLLAIGRAGEARAMARGTTISKARWYYVRSEHSGYAVVPQRLPRGVRAHFIRPAAQSSEPRPGPTLILQLATRARTVSATVRLIPARDLAAARRMVNVG